jgi:REP element-mobilizing transposase RayT
MIHGYHLIWGTYGFWLPNDPRGSWSDFVASWELARFGKSKRTLDRAAVLPEDWSRWRTTAQRALKFPEVVLTGLQARAVATGFAESVRESGFTIWACSILPQRVHLVVARHTFAAEQIANLLKGEATKQLKAQSLYPQAKRTVAGGKLPSIWSGGQWKGYLDSEEAIENAIRYVEENPVKEGMARQNWSFVTPFAGIDQSGWTTYH